MSDLELALQYVAQQEERLRSEGRQVLSQGEALQLESRLLVSQALRLLCQQLSLSGTGSAPSP